MCYECREHRQPMRGLSSDLLASPQTPRHPPRLQSTTLQWHLYDGSMLYPPLQAHTMWRSEWQYI